MNYQKIFDLLDGRKKGWEEIRDNPETAKDPVFRLQAIANINEIMLIKQNVQIIEMDEEDERERRMNVAAQKINIIHDD